jgi:hypothetical protein
VRNLGRERGQVTAEYLGVIVLIAAVLAAVAASGIGSALTGAIEDAICKVAGDCSGRDGGGSDGEEPAPGDRHAAERTDPDDPDGDGISSDIERRRGLDPNTFDSDGDTYGDAEERRFGTDPAVEDTDGDGLDDGEEIAQQGAQPDAALDADSDDDGLSDGEERAIGTDPFDEESDPHMGSTGDGLTDGEEVRAGTDPLSADTDGDGTWDEEEVRAGTDPLADERSALEKAAGAVGDAVLDDPTLLIPIGGAVRGLAGGTRALIQGGKGARLIRGADSAEEAARIRAGIVNRLRSERRRLADDAAEGLSPRVKQLAEANLTGSGDTVLGHFPGYVEKARRQGASYFDIGDAWNGLTAAQRTAANQHFLDRIAASGDRVVLSVPKTKVRPGSALADEIRYLTREKGYRWVNQWSLRPR